MFLPTKKGFGLRVPSFSQASVEKDSLTKGQLCNLLHGQISFDRPMYMIADIHVYRHVSIFCFRAAVPSQYGVIFQRVSEQPCFFSYGRTTFFFSV